MMMMVMASRCPQEGLWSPQMLLEADLIDVGSWCTGGCQELQNKKKGEALGENFPSLTGFPSGSSRAEWLWGSVPKNVPFPLPIAILAEDFFPMPCPTG